MKKGLMRFELSPREQATVDAAIDAHLDEIDFHAPSSPPFWAKFDDY